MVSVATRWLKSPYIIRLVTYPSQRSPINFSEEPKIQVWRDPTRDSDPAGSAQTVRNQALSDGFRLAGQEQRGYQEEVGGPLLQVTLMPQVGHNEG